MGVVLLGLVVSGVCVAGVILIVLVSVFGVVVTGMVTSFSLSFLNKVKPAIGIVETFTNFTLGGISVLMGGI